MMVINLFKGLVKMTERSMRGEHESNRSFYKDGKQIKWSNWVGLLKILLPFRQRLGPPPDISNC